MSQFSLPALAALAALVACSARADAEAPLAQSQLTPLGVEASAAAPIQHVAASAVISCDVRSRRTANGVLIQARGFADRDIFGEYDLVITKSGGGGSADISQSGAVELAAGATAVLGESEISMERGARLRAVLTLRDESGQLCRHTFNL